MIINIQELIDTHTIGMLDVSHLPLKGTKFPELMPTSMNLTGSDISGVKLPTWVEGDLWLVDCIVDEHTVFPEWVEGRIFMSKELHELVLNSVSQTYH
jgi:hypothetical protein